MSLENIPLVSCLCITHNKVDLLKRSIDCFFNQSYPNKELVVTYMSDNVKTAKFIATLNDQRIVRHEIPESSKMTLGEKRNRAIQKSNGFYFCTWDDDDWHNRNRLALQVNDLKQNGYKCSVLSNLLIYDTETQEGFVSANRAWEQTILCEKSLIDHDTVRYAHFDKGEDTVLLSDLLAKDVVASIFNPGLYIYIYHGKNTWHREHWLRNVINRGDALTSKQSLTLKEILEGNHSHERASELLKDFVVENA